MDRKLRNEFEHKRAGDHDCNVNIFVLCYN